MYLKLYCENIIFKYLKEHLQIFRGGKLTKNNFKTSGKDIIFKN